MTAARVAIGVWPLQLETGSMRTTDWLTIAEDRK